MTDKLSFDQLVLMQVEIMKEVQQHLARMLELGESGLQLTEKIALINDKGERCAKHILAWLKDEGLIETDVPLSEIVLLHRAKDERPRPLERGSQVTYDKEGSQ